MAKKKKPKGERERSVHVSARPWPPDALDMTHALNGLKGLGIKSSLGPHGLSFPRETPATVQLDAVLSADEQGPNYTPSLCMWGNKIGAVMTWS